MGPRVVPGTYTVRITLGSETVEHRLVVEQDPRVGLTRRQAQSLHDLSRSCLDGSVKLRAAERTMRSIDASLTKAMASEPMKNAPKPLADRAAALQKRSTAVLDRMTGPSRAGEQVQTLGPSGQVIQVTGRSASSVAARLAQTFMTIESLPVEPSAAWSAEIAADLRNARSLIAEAQSIADKLLPKLNADLSRAKLPEITVAEGAEDASSAGGSETDGEEDGDDG